MRPIATQVIIQYRSGSQSICSTDYSSIQTLFRLKEPFNDFSLLLEIARDVLALILNRLLVTHSGIELILRLRPLRKTCSVGYPT